VDRLKTLGLAGRLLVIGLGVSAIGSLVLPRTLPDRAAFVASWPSERITSGVDQAQAMIPLNRAGDHDALITIASSPLHAFPGSPASRFAGPDARLDQGDARLYLRDAAAAAHRLVRARPGQGETRTDLWINAPETIGSTSPRDAILISSSIKE
jgi:hypothetical protein